MDGRILVALGAIFLSSCAGLGRVDPPEPPSTAEIEASSTEIANWKLPAPEYVKAGYRRVDQNCDKFFRDLSQTGRNFDFTRRETVLGIATTSSVLALLQNDAETLALFAAGSAFLSNSLDNAADYALLTKYTGQLQTIVNGKRSLYKSSNSPDGVGNDKYKADDFVRGYANTCTIDAMEADIAQSLSIVQPVLQSGTTLETAAGIIIKKELGLAKALTDDDVRRLQKLLVGADQDRKGVASSDVLVAAKGKYWTVAGSLTTSGSKMKSLLDTIEASEIDNSAQAPTTADVSALMAGHENGSTAASLLNATNGQGSATQIPLVPKAGVGNAQKQ